MQDLRNHVLGRIEPLHRHHRGPTEERQQETDGQHEAVEHRQKHHQTIVLRQVQEVPAGADVRQQIAVGQHRPLRMARGPARVDEHRQIVTATDRLRNFGRLGGQRLRIQDLKRRMQGLQFGQARMARLGDDPLDARVLEHVGHFRRLEEVVDRHHHRVRGQDPEQGSDELRTILQPDRHTISRSDPLLPKKACRS